MKFSGTFLLKLSLTGIFLVGISFAQPIRDYKNNPEKAVKQHLAFEEYEQAIPQLQILVSEEPANAYYQYWLGKCLYLTYKKNQALKHLEKASQINPNVDAELPWYYGLCLHYNHHFDEAIAQYKLILEASEDGSEKYLQAANRIEQCRYAKKLVTRREGDLVKIENLGGLINSEYSEHSPVISGNDSILLYTARRPECLGADPAHGFYDEDIYLAHKQQDGSWSRGKNIMTPVNSKGHDATISLSADGKDLYLYRHKKAGGLYHTNWDSTGKEWKEPKIIEKPLNSKYYEACVAQSADGNLMFFTSNRPGGYGGKDIYVVRKNGNDWSEPENLGPRINTPWDEDGPYFHPDGKTLYYSSNGPKSVGGFDIFVTEFDSTAGGWLEPLNMGFPVNTPDDDIYFVLSETGLIGYYSSGKEGGYGEKDIYRILFPYFRYPKRYYAVEVVGIIQDEASRDTLDAFVRIFDAESGKILDSVSTDPENKEYHFEVEGGVKYKILAEASGYPQKLDSIQPPNSGDDDYVYRKDFMVLKPKIEVIPEVKVVREEKIIEIQHVYYDFDKSNLRAEGAIELNIAINLLKQDPSMTLEILGHTDWYGNYDYNVALSHRRTQTVYDYLISQGIDPSRVSENWFSENKPIETNDNDDGRQFNRRAEIRVVKNGQVVLASKKLKTGGVPPWVDHATPKGKPGFDNPSGAPSPYAESELKENQYSTDYKIITDKEVTSSSGNYSSSIDGLTLRNIYFDFDQYSLTDESVNRLNQVIRILKAHPDYRLEILGHTDNFGSDVYNQNLSDNRCNAAYKYLLGEGASPDQLFLTGYSEHKPIKPNDSDLGRHFNRRVEFVIVKDDNVVARSVE